MNRAEYPSPGRPGQVASILLALIRFYRRHVSCLKPATCRFVPTCSDYAGQAIRKYGALKGLSLAARRVLRCHPYHPGGEDPVP